MWRKFRTLWQKEEGQGLTEYALIIALVSVALVATLGLLTGGIQTSLNNVIASL
ncbi:MAG: Flp family type IVb pilin [Candidatus Bipolaricaulia bacterium]